MLDFSIGILLLAFFVYCIFGIIFVGIVLFIWDDKKFDVDLMSWQGALLLLIVFFVWPKIIFNKPKV